MLITTGVPLSVCLSVRPVLTLKSTGRKKRVGDFDVMLQPEVV